MPHRTELRRLKVPLAISAGLAVLMTLVLLTGEPDDVIGEPTDVVVICAKPGLVWAELFGQRGRKIDGATEYRVAVLATQAVVNFVLYSIVLGAAVLYAQAWRSALSSFVRVVRRRHRR